MSHKKGIGISIQSFILLISHNDSEIHTTLRYNGPIWIFIWSKIVDNVGC